MLKDTDKYETSAHFSYNQYKKKVKKSPNKDLVVFSSVFIIGVLTLLGFARILSPNVDVGISDENEMVASTVEEETAPSAIDERLKHIQMEDEGKKVEDEDMFSPELDEKVVLPNHNKKTVGQMEAEMADFLSAQKSEQMTNEQQHKEQKSVEQKSIFPQKTQTQSEQAAPAPAPAQIVNAKVVVGTYATEKQAEVAKSIIQDAGVGVTPIVKNLGGYYTLQVGAYTSREKAQQAANNLLKSNFPARVVVD